MNNNKTAAWVIVILLIIVGAVYLVERSHETVVTTTPASTTTGGTTPTATTVADYYCSQGSIVATYAPNTASLTLSDGRTMTLTQGVSGSGVRYASADGNTVFDTEGSNAFLTENGTTTYDNCVAGTQTTSGTSFTFTDASKMFSFTYPNTGTLSGSLGYDTNWRAGTQESGMLLASVSIPGSIEPKTNLGDSKFTVGTSSDPTAVAKCLTENEEGSSKGTVVTINGVQYTKLTMSDAGAGNLYDTTSYRTVRNGQCYAIEYTIHSSELGNYDPSQGISAYDKTSVMNMFEGIVQSFKFI